MELPLLIKQHPHPTKLIAICATLLLLLAHNILPKKIYTISATEGYKELHLYSGQGYEHGNEVGWENKDALHMRCTIKPDQAKQGCGLDILFYTWPNWTRGINLSGYNNVLLDIKYHGSAKKVRLFARNFDTLYSNKKDFNSTKYNTINLRIKDLTSPIKVPLDDFVVADWWQDQFDISIHHSHVDFRNITGMGFDFGAPIPLGEHSIEFKKIQFIGEYISRESWYLAIMLAWLFAIGITTVRNMIRLREKAKHYSRQVLDLQENNNELQTTADKYRVLSTTDSLTGTYNRFGIDKTINSLFTELNQHLPTSIIMVDIDHFKQINDERGHDIGDTVLAKLGRTIVDNIRQTDFVGRWGGEEFIIICPDTNINAAYNLAEKIRQTIAILTFEGNSNAALDLTITASLGVGEIHEGEHFPSAFKRVDTALYQAKQAGRNQTIKALYKAGPHRP